MDWVDPISSDSIEKNEDDMSSLANGFALRMCKRATSIEGETTLGSEASSGKCPKRSGPGEEAQKGMTAIAVDSPERAFDALPALEGAA